MIESLRRHADTKKNSLYGERTYEKASGGHLNSEPPCLFWFSVNGERALQTCIIPFLRR